MNEDFQAKINLADIDVGDRARQDYGDLTELVKSIRDNGLIHPIAISIHSNPDSKFKYALRAGGRRLKAHEILGLESIMCRVYNRVLNELECKTVELSENIHRKDMTPFERALLESEVHELQEALYGKKISPTGEGASLIQTSRVLGISTSKMAEDMEIVRMAKMFPDLEWDKCKTKQELKKMTMAVKTSLTRSVAADKALVEMREDGRFEKICNSFIIGDFFKQAENLPDNFFDFVEIDPPYAIDLERVKKDYAYSGYNEVKAENEEKLVGVYHEFMSNTFSICHKKMKPNSWGVCWFGPDPWYSYIYQWLLDAGFETTGLTGVWAKGEADETGVVAMTTGQANQPYKYLAYSVENFFYFWKGQPTLNRPGRTNHFGYKPVSPKQKYHPTQRPSEMISDLLTTFVGPCSQVLVPFAGSGTTILEAFSNGMSAIGYDLTDSYKEGFVVRAKEVVKNGRGEERKIEGVECSDGQA